MFVRTHDHAHVHTQVLTFLHGCVYMYACAHADTLAHTQPIHIDVIS